ncbi:MAG: terminase small subunit [Gammaproteobacteria bacterium]|nr:terminase small subunit [Gammaproteobacteria bacterium]MBU1732648.1 terminase small subunit [Gammaproteobacteria bacterium]MBU1893511.1 terminase small subunit [Gammaproteobacteria bacterium]
MNLTPRQQLFVSEYLIDGNGARAARSAGYSEKTARQIATENLSKPYIQAAITAKQQETAVKLELRKEHVLLAHMEAINLARAQGQPMAMISGAREIGKLMGFYSVEAVEFVLGKNEASLRARYESMTDAELMAIVDG